MEWEAWETMNAERGTRNAGEARFGIGDSAVAHGAVVQSERMAEYEGVLQRLWERGAVYPCTCTRAEIVKSVMAGGQCAM